MEDWVDTIDFSQYDLQDLMFDAPILFRRIIDETIAADDGYGFDPNRVWLYEIEMAAITAAQWEAFGGQSAQAKTNRYDYEIQKIKNDLMWAGVQSADTVEVVFWQDNFDPLVSFARRTKRITVMKLLDVQYEEMKEAGFSYDFIAKTSAVLGEWAEKLLNPNEKEFAQEQEGQEYDEQEVDALEQEQTEYDIDEESNVSSDIASDLFSMFFADDDTDAGGEGDGE